MKQNTKRAATSRDVIRRLIEETVKFDMWAIVEASRPIHVTKEGEIL